MSRAGSGRRTGRALAAGTVLAAVLALAVPDARAGISGKILIQRKGCLACHSLMGSGAHMGPPLQNTPAWSPPDRMRKYIKDPKSVNPKSIMPAARLSEAEVDAIVDYLQGFKGEAKAPEGWKPK